MRRFLAGACITFAAYGAASDRRKLRTHHGLELVSMLELLGTVGMGNASMAEMVDRMLGIHDGLEVVVPTGRVVCSGARTSASVTACL